ncbi:hypothetical protein AC579_90 [Pseudocercospora musae]|uniref:Berberine/berberine-like domain-containing protein n=1 Tax=Pseudocercospora musae TaxID=113226 RepID=A0A139IHF0_9PEZI|nr:hypothetical protein AC579_90 [Pseudocercospora musae]
MAQPEGSGYEQVWGGMRAYTPDRRLDVCVPSQDSPVTTLTPKPLSFQLFNTLGFSRSFRVATYPNLPEDRTVQFLDTVYNTTYQITLENDILDIEVAGFIPQPMSARIQAASHATGGKCIGLDANQGMPPTHYVSEDIYTSNYNPLFMNDAAPDQDVFSSYGTANIQRFLQIKNSYDPTSFFTTR